MVPAPPACSKEPVVVVLAPPGCCEEPDAALDAALDVALLTAAFNAALDAALDAAPVGLLLRGEGPGVWVP
jgi:hypothetical protein